MIAHGRDALLGLARADQARGWSERARERYAAALDLMEPISDWPQELITEARLGSQGSFGD